MQPQPLKTTLIMSSIFTVLVVLFVSFTDEPTIEVIAVNAVLVFAIIFFTMRLTNRLTVAIVNRWGSQPGKQQDASEAPPPPPSSTRPEHAQRRRQRRRTRRRHRE